jgi:LPXTG-motif cell wall-anchored protein
MSLVATGVAAAAETTVTGQAGIAKDGNGKKISYPLFDEQRHAYDAYLITLTIGEKAAEAYCIDLKHPLKEDGTYQETAWKSSTVRNLGMVQWVLVHSVPNVTADDVLKNAKVPRPTGVSDEELQVLVYAATQGAVWHFSDGFTVGANPGEGARPRYDLVKSVYDYLATNARSESEPVATLGISPGSATGEVGTKLGPYTVTSSSPATVTATGGKIVDANGAQLNGPVADGGKFWLTSDAAGKVTVDANAEGKIPTGRVFTFAQKPNDVQKIILAGVIKTKLTARATGTFTPKGAVPAAPAPTLPVTGASAVGATVAGLLLLAGGGVLVALLRRRRIKFTA